MPAETVITVDLAYGDSGKGSVVDVLVRKLEATLVVRYNGGAQAAHCVVTPNGYTHIFRQFGSGSLISGVQTLLSRHMLVDPVMLIAEQNRLSEYIDDPLTRVYIDERAAIVTPYHKALNRLRECARGNNPNGSCGMGIGETANDLLLRPDEALRAKDLLLDERNLQHKLSETRAALWRRTDGMRWPISAVTLEACDLFNFSEQKLAEHFKSVANTACIVDASTVNFMLQTHTSVFEGAQGVLLDENYGFHPYTTWSTTTAKNALEILKEAGIAHKVTQVGILRTFATRHGPGPFVTEAPELQPLLPDPHNVKNQWQRDFRLGWLDLHALKYALEVNGPVDYLAVTHADKLSLKPRWNVCTEYAEPLKKPSNVNLIAQEELTKRLLQMRYTHASVAHESLLTTIENELQTPLGIISCGPRSTDKDFTAEFKTQHKQELTNEPSI